MNIAVVGGGRRCKQLMEAIERHEFQEVHPKVVAVADVNADAQGIVKAKKRRPSGPLPTVRRSFSGKFHGFQPCRKKRIRNSRKPARAIRRS